MSRAIKGKTATEYFRPFCSGSVLLTAAHYTVRVSLQYRCTPAESNRSDSFAVSGGFTCFVWQDAPRPVAYIRSCTESWHSRSSRRPESRQTPVTLARARGNQPTSVPVENHSINWSDDLEWNCMAYIGHYWTGCGIKGGRYSFFHCMS